MNWPKIGRAVFPVMCLLLWAQESRAQSVLNFAYVVQDSQTHTGISVTNPTAKYAEIRFTFYDRTGNSPASGMANPVRYRIPPKGQLSMFASDIFQAANLQGWVQATSETTGLDGSYLVGDFSSSLASGGSFQTLSNQILPLIKEDAQTVTDIFVVNTSGASEISLLTLYDVRGAIAGSLSINVAGNATVDLPFLQILPKAASGNYTAILSSTVSVAAFTLVTTGQSSVAVQGQPTDRLFQIRFAPGALTPGNAQSTLVLANPSSVPVTAGLTLFGIDGNVVPASAGTTVSIPGNGLALVDLAQAAGNSATASAVAFVRLDSASVPLTGVVLESGSGKLAALNITDAPSGLSLYSQVTDTDTFTTQLGLINATAQSVAVQLWLIRRDGTTLGTTSLTLPPVSNTVQLLRNLVPAAAGQDGGFVVLQSSVPVYSFEALGSVTSPLTASIPSQLGSESLIPEPVTDPPRIVSITPSEAKPGDTVVVTAAGGFQSNAVVLINGNVVTSSLVALFSVFSVQVPQVEPGFVKVQLRAGGAESAPAMLQIDSPGGVPTQTIAGRSFYEKIDVTDDGLDLAHPEMVPVRGARVEVIDPSTQNIVSVSETDAIGGFQVTAPVGQNLTVQVESQLRSLALRVVDNVHGNALYVVTAGLANNAPASPLSLIATDSTRVSGAFNILEVIQEANDLLKDTAPDLVLPAPTVFWSPLNSSAPGAPKEAIGGTFFNSKDNSISFLGDRSMDSDEFDDSVIAHEYGHLVAAAFSRDDSPGGLHLLGDALDPRLAWSEGWANFFSGAVRNDSIFRDSFGANGSSVYRFDLEVNVPTGDHPGYWSEFSVGSLLWDLYDDVNGDGDTVQYPFSSIWTAFVDLQSDRWIYLPYFLENFLTVEPSSASSLISMTQVRSIDFHPSLRPSVTIPFPTPTNVGDSIIGTVDSLSTQRSDLMQSAQFFSFTTTGGQIAIRMDITGLGPTPNPAANDLDLYLWDINGRIVAVSNSGLNGQPERIATTIPSGSYVAEVRSYYTDGQTNKGVFNSGQYRLTISGQ